MSNSVFEGIENAKTTDRLPFIQEGSYLLEVETVKIVQGRTAGPMFCVEYNVLESKGESANAKGTKCSHLIKLKGNDSALGNVKSFAAALMPDEGKITAQMVDNLVSAANPAKGEKIRVDAFLTKTKAGNDFTRVTYSPVGGESATPVPVSGETSSTAKKTAKK